MTKTSQIHQQIKSDLKPYIFLTPEFFNVQKQNNLQGNGSYRSYLEATSSLIFTPSEMELEYMQATVNTARYSPLDYSKYKFEIKDLKFNRDEINER